MAITMKSLMDEFHEYSKLYAGEDDFVTSQAFDVAETLANECHGMTPNEIFTFLENSLTHNAEKANSSEESLAFKEVLEVLHDFTRNRREK